MSSSEESPVVITENDGTISKITEWAKENKLKAIVIVIVIVVMLLWWANDKGYMEGMPLAIPFNIGKRNPRGSKTDNDNDDDDSDDDSEASIEDQIGEIVEKQTELWDSKIQKGEVA